jgi:hypothetical protein
MVFFFLEKHMATMKISGYDALIDDEDYERLKGFHYHVRRIEEKHGRYYFDRHVCIEGKRAKTSLHRDIMGCVNGDGKTVDHTYGDTLDCRKTNLRLSTPAENIRNQRVHKDNTSGVKGVYFHKPTRKWFAQISVDGCRHSLGLYTDIKDAEKAYAEASAKYHGEFGMTK